MDRPSFLIFSIIGLFSMVALHLGEIWLGGQAMSLKQFLLEWLPLYCCWASLLLIGVFKRSLQNSENHFHTSSGKHL
ncbi:hypothetical protein [Photobacterium sp. J15]|uniref:hypothetical protein n=1 Tax=Photobacterium sp. J15 TaxID=265901 RepID=UPI0007E3E7EA|nr:hypothetical protein [Photobacterium sp. J15]